MICIVREDGKIMKMFPRDKITLAEWERTELELKSWAVMGVGDMTHYRLGFID
jgi:hypothetical protein